MNLFDKLTKNQNLRKKRFFFGGMLWVGGVEGGRGWWLCGGLRGGG